MSCDDKTWSKLTELIRTQKHWMLNQFQIVMGYIQIGKTDSAFEFIKRATSEVEGTSIFTQLSNEEVGVRACLLWWRMKESNFLLYPIIDRNLHPDNTEEVFTRLEAFMDDLRHRYYQQLTDKHLTWRLQKQANKLVSILKTDDDIELPNLYEDNTAFLGKVYVEGNVITYELE